LDIKSPIREKELHSKIDPQSEVTAENYSFRQPNPGTGIAEVYKSYRI